MKNLVICTIILLITAGLDVQAAPKQKVKQIYLEYKSPYKSLELKDNSLIVTEKKDQFDNPASSIPSGSKSEVREYSLTKKEVNDLIIYIKNSKFFGLNNSYGAPEKERNYPTVIFIIINGKEKRVIYRSNPSFESKPEVFKKVEAYILQLRKQ